jgi:hypothetical protein
MDELAKADAVACLEVVRRCQRRLDQGAEVSASRTRLIEQLTASGAPGHDLERVRGWQRTYDAEVAPVRAAHRQATERLARAIGPHAAATALALLDGWEQPLPTLVDAAVSLARDA